MLSGVLKSWKASRISDSVVAEMWFSLASLVRRGALSEGGGGTAVGRRLGGWTEVSRRIASARVAYHDRFVVVSAGEKYVAHV